MKYCRFCGDAMVATGTGPAKKRVTTWTCSGGCSQVTAQLSENTEQLPGGTGSQTESMIKAVSSGCYRTRSAPHDE